jgi:transcriptional regulator with XRE-family HTH domain
MKKRFGAVLRTARENNRLSRQRLGNMLGSSMKTIQSWEMGRTFPEDLELIPRLEGLLGIRFDRILTEEEHDEPAPVLKLTQTWKLSKTKGKREQGALTKGQEVYIPTMWLREADTCVIAADRIAGWQLHGVQYLAVRPLRPDESWRGDYASQDHLLVDDEGELRIATTASRKKRWTYRVAGEDGAFSITPEAKGWTCLGRILWMIAGLERLVG